MRVIMRPGAQRRHRAVGPGEQANALDAAEDQRADEAAEEAAVGDEAALPHLEDVDEVVEAIEVGEDVEQPRADDGRAGRPHVAAAHELAVHAVALAQRRA